MDKEMTKRWNNKVGKGDVVFHLGDFALGSEKEIKELKDSLNGKIFLLKGNHDHKSLRKAGFTIINGTFEIGNFIFSHNPLKKEDIPIGFINVHGHIHERESLNGINVCVEKINYAPIDFTELKKVLKDSKFKDSFKGVFMEKKFDIDFKKLDQLVDLKRE